MRRAYKNPLRQQRASGKRRNTNHPASIVTETRGGRKEEENGSS